MDELLKRRLKEFRLKRGWTQSRLANYLGISLGTVVSLEHGRKCMDLTRAKVEQRLSEAEAA